VVRHRWWVFAVWGIVLIAGGISASQVQDQLTHNLSLPRQEGSETQSALARSYGVESEVGYLPVLTAPDGESITKHQDGVAAVADQIR
jgi:uncharacterized membrane protein YdfJ with MMPL/SSD domain